MANQDQNLNYGWANQKLGAVAGQTGYSQNGVNPASPTVSAAEQASSGASAAPAPTAVAEVLTNPGYASSPANISTGPITAPVVPASTVAVQNPTGLNATVSILTGTLTVISVAPLVNGAAGTFTQVGTTAPANVSVPPGGFIKMTYSVAPTWAWVATN